MHAWLKCFAVKLGDRSCKHLRFPRARLQDEYSTTRTTAS
jgi:hypothetical protein